MMSLSTIILSFIAVFVCLNNMGVKQLSNELVHIEISAYEVSKVDEISDKIINRVPIESSYFIYIKNTPDLVSDIEDYNRLLGHFVQVFTDSAMTLVISQCMLKDNNGNELTTNPEEYTQMPPNLHTLVDKIVKYCLYTNSSDLIFADPSLAQITAGLTGGSLGVWPLNFQYTILHKNHPDIVDEYDNFMKLADMLVDDLCNLRMTFFINDSGLHHN